jgi:hypothetical protein
VPFLLGIRDPGSGINIPDQQTARITAQAQEYQYQLSIKDKKSTQSTYSQNPESIRPLWILYPTRFLLICTDTSSNQRDPNSRGLGSHHSKSWIFISHHSVLNTYGTACKRNNLENQILMYPPNKKATLQRPYNSLLLYST